MALSAKCCNAHDVVLRKDKLTIIPGRNISADNFQLSFALNLSHVQYIFHAAVICENVHKPSTC